MAEFIEFEVQDIESGADYEMDNEVAEMHDEVSSFIDDSSINDESMIGGVYNYGLPNTTRIYEDVIKDPLDNVENCDGENFNYVFDPDNELDEINEIIDDRSNTKKKKQDLDSKNSFFQSIYYTIRYIKQIKKTHAKTNNN